MISYALNRVVLLLFRLQRCLLAEMSALEAIIFSRVDFTFMESANLKFFDSINILVFCRSQRPC